MARDGETERIHTWKTILFFVIVSAKYEQKKRDLSDCNETRIHNHLVCKQTLNHLAKLFSIYLFFFFFFGCGFESRCSHLNFRYRFFHDKNVLTLFQKKFHDLKTSEFKCDETNWFQCDDHLGL